MTSNILTRVVLISLAIVIAFASGRFLFPARIDVGTERTYRTNDSTTVVPVDSLIVAWCDERAADLFTAAGLLRVGPPAIPGARIGFFPDTVRHLANQVHERYGIPPAVVLAQFALESRFGTSDLNAMNFFGHKFQVAQKYGPQPAQRTMAATREFIGDEWVTVKLPFAKYSSPGDCFDTHGKLLSRSIYYKRALKYATDARLYARELGRYYATDPDYALKLTTIMTRYKLI